MSDFGGGAAGGEGEPPQKNTLIIPEGGSFRTRVRRVEVQMEKFDYHVN